MPQREWLAHYAKTFDTVEINNTFYRLPSEDAVKGWVEQTPQGFEYAVKASRYLTHVKKLKDLAKYGKTRRLPPRLRVPPPELVLRGRLRDAA